MLAALKSFYPTDASGNIILTPDLQSKMILIVNNDDTYAERHVWDDSTQMRQTIHEQQFDRALAPEAMIRSGRTQLPCCRGKGRELRIRCHGLACHRTDRDQWFYTWDRPVQF